MTMPHDTEDAAGARPSDAPELLGEIVQSATRLLRNEVELARRDIAHRLSRAGTGILMLVGAIALLVTSVNVLAAAAVAALVAAGMSEPLAALIVACAGLALAAILFVIGKSRLAPAALAPKTALASLRRDIDTIREKTHG